MLATVHPFQILSVHQSINHTAQATIQNQATVHAQKCRTWQEHGMDKEVRVACRVLQHIRRRATKLPKVTALWTLGLMVAFRPMSCDVMSMPKLPPSCQHVVKTCQHMSKLAKIANAAACCHSSVTSPPGCTPRFGVAMLQCDLTVCCFTVFNSTHPKHATTPMQDSF